LPIVSRPDTVALMKLYLTMTSPYARKVRVVIREHELDSQVEMVIANPLDDPPELRAASAIGKVPVLVDDARVIYDSRVICDYLDGRALGTTLVPNGEDAWADRTRVALGDGLMDAAVAIVMEGRRAASERSPSAIARQTERIECVVRTAPSGELGRPTMGDIAVASALTYLDFRLPELGWRRHAPALADWHAAVEARPAFASSPLG